MSAATHPKWKYHATEAPVIVADEAAEAALDGDWFDSPADVPAADAEPKKAEPKHKAKG